MESLYLICGLVLVAFVAMFLIRLYGEDQAAQRRNGTVNLIYRTDSRMKSRVKRIVQSNRVRDSSTRTIRYATLSYSVFRRFQYYQMKRVLLEDGRSKTQSIHSNADVSDKRRHAAHR